MKRLILFFALAMFGIMASAQVRTKEIKSSDSLVVKINGNKRHKFTNSTFETQTIDATGVEIGGTDITTMFPPASEGVTNGDSHDHNGGDGATIDHVNLSNKGTNTQTQIDSHIGDASDPHGTTLTQQYLIVSGNITSTSGSIVNTSTTTILDTYEEDNGIWLLTFTGEHTDFSSAFFGYGAYLISRNRNTYTSTWQPFVLKLFTESYTARVVVSVSGDVVRLQSNLADGTYPLYWTLLRLR